MSRTITRTYDARGRILSERTEVDGLPAATLAYTYDALGRPSSVTCGNGVTQTRTYTSHPLLDASRWRFAGKEIQPLGGTGWLDFGARQYDSFIGRWTTMDPLAEKYPAVSPYAYCAGNPVNLVDRTGEFPETLWDIANVVLDIKSLASNVKEGNAGTAVLDGIGLVADAAAVILPVVPGGAGSILKAARGTDKAVDAVNGISKVSDADNAISNYRTVSSIKEALIEAKAKIGLSPTESLTKSKGKFDSPYRGDSRKGYRLDPPHSKNGTESKPHINYWDYTIGKRNRGGVSGSVEIK